MLSHDDLLNDINCRDVKAGASAIWWLGQHSFIVKMADKVLYFDPFLSEHPSRLVPPLLNANEVVNADLVFGSHDHTDHIDHGALEPGLTIPGHCGMFENNTLDPALFADYMAVKYPHLNIHLCEPGVWVNV